MHLKVTNLDSSKLLHKKVISFVEQEKFGNILFRWLLSSDLKIFTLPDECHFSIIFQDQSLCLFYITLGGRLMSPLKILWTGYWWHSPIFQPWNMTNFTMQNMETLYIRHTYLLYFFRGLHKGYTELYCAYTLTNHSTAQYAQVLILLTFIPHKFLTTKGLS